MNEVIVGTKHRVKSCMRLGLNWYDIENGNIVRQNPVPSKEQIKFPFLFNVDMKEILAGMNTGIRTSAAIYFDWIFEDFT